MGILNVTPDSFSDGGAFSSVDEALARARQMVEEGADIIDIGGESTRPGAESVSEQEELDRVLPVILALAAELPVPISIDTSKAAVMREAVAAGAGMINDVLALQAPGALAAAVETTVPVCLMHMRGKPRSMQINPEYRDVVAEVGDFFRARIDACETAGITRDRLLLDPGFGFGKTHDHNRILLKNLRQFAAIGMPLLAGISRKSMIGAMLNDAPVEKRLYGSLAAAAMALERGAAILRVHDVGPTAEVVQVVFSVLVGEQTKIG